MSDVKKTVEQLMASPEALTAFVEAAIATETKLADSQEALKLTESLLVEAAGLADKKASKTTNKNTVTFTKGKKSGEYHVLTPLFTLPGHGDKVFTAADLAEGKVVVHVKSHGEPSKEVNIVDYAIDKGIVSPITE